MEVGIRDEQVQSVGQALRRRAEDRGGRAENRRRVARFAQLGASLASAVRCCSSAAPRCGAQDAPERLDRGRFTAVFFPDDRALATSLLDGAVKNDSFPGLPRPRQRVLLAIAPDRRRFREWIGPGAPEWGAAITFPESQRIVMQGRSSGSDAGDPREVLRHELAHLALHESLGDLPPRWFDEGYASYCGARVEPRGRAGDEPRAGACAARRRSTSSTAQFAAGSMTAQNAYALAYRAVVELASMDTVRGLSRFFDAWRTSGSHGLGGARDVRLDAGRVRAAVAPEDAAPLRGARVVRRRRRWPG